MESVTYPSLQDQTVNLGSCLAINEVQGPVNLLERIQWLELPTFDEVLQYSAQIIQGDVCIARSSETRERYASYLAQLTSQGRRPVDDIREQAQDASYFLIPNRFPYGLSDAEHWLLFLMKDNCTLDGAGEVLLQHLDREQVALENVFAYQNQYNLRSIPELPHFQLIIRR